MKNEHLGNAMNPYEPSQTPIPVATFVDSVDWLEIFWEWERRRVLYNVILVIIVLMSGMMFTGFSSSLIVTMGECIAAGFIANCCFCAGPVVETYFTWQSHKRVGWGNLLFVVGLLFSILVTVIALQMHHQIFVLPRPLTMDAIQF